MTQRLLLGIIAVVLALIIGITLFTNYGKKIPLQREPKATVTPTKPPMSQLPVAKTPQQQVVKQVKLFFIALNDNGKSGKRIGCGDSVVSVAKPVQPTTEPLIAALEELLLVKTQFFGQSGLYNALYQSDLRLQSVSISKGGVATVQLLGTQAISGVCDDPRIIAQLRETALQFPSVREVQIFINTYPIEQLLSGKGR